MYNKVHGMKATGQASIELIAVISFLLLIFLVVVATSTQKHRESNALKTLLDAKRVANSVADNINTISQQGPGYYRRFSLPETIFGYTDYDVTIAANIVEISWGDQAWSTQTAASNVMVMELRKGDESNCIVNKNGEICVTPYCDVLTILLYQTGSVARDNLLLNDIGGRCNVRVIETSNVTLLEGELNCYDMLWFAYDSIYGSYQNNLTIEAEASVKSYVNDGGMVWSSSQNDDGWDGAWSWLPYEVGLDSFEGNVTEESPSELFSSPNTVNLTKLLLGESYENWNAAYSVIAYLNGTTENAHFLNLNHGAGRYLLSSVQTGNISYDSYNILMSENAIGYLNPRFEC